MSKKHILVVEDDRDIAELLRHNLNHAGYAVSMAECGPDALTLLGRQGADLVLLDLMLPGMSGLEICRALKQDQRIARVPVIMVTAKGEDTDIVVGLEMGADDYVTKPFSVKVLLARIRLALRNREAKSYDPMAVLCVQNLTVDPGRHEVRVRGKEVLLTLTEFRTVHLLASRPGWVFTRQQILDAARGEDVAVSERAVDVQIVGIRKKLGPGADYIEAVRGVGYRMVE